MLFFIFGSVPLSFYVSRLCAPRFWGPLDAPLGHRNRLGLLALLLIFEGVPFIIGGLSGIVVWMFVMSRFLPRNLIERLVVRSQDTQAERNLAGRLLDALYRR